MYASMDLVVLQGILNCGFIDLQKIDTTGESIELASATQIDVGQLSESIPTDVPRFSFFAYKHNYNGEEFDSIGVKFVKFYEKCTIYPIREILTRLSLLIVFIYTCPPSSKIRERMLYSSSKASVISTGQSECGLTIAKKVRLEIKLIWLL